VGRTTKLIHQPLMNQSLIHQPLTPRQRAFLDKLLELYRERREPVHYSDVAKRLGVNRFSAYDMLKVLEKKGFATSSYALEAQGSTIMAAGAVDDRLDDDWFGVRERVLKKLREAQEANRREVLNDLMARLPEAKAPLAFCAQMIGALLLNMGRVRARSGELNPFRALAAFRVSDSAGLETLAGLSVGATLAADEESSSSITRRLLDQAQRYQTSLARLSEEARSALAQFLEEALEAFD
jgi:hypothetical protein